jgi:hypothetical protein
VASLVTWTALTIPERVAVVSRQLRVEACMMRKTDARLSMWAAAVGDSPWVVMVHVVSSLVWAAGGVVRVRSIVESGVGEGCEVGPMSTGVVLPADNRWWMEGADEAAGSGTPFELAVAGLLCHHISSVRRFWGGSSQEAVRSAKAMNSPKMTMKNTRIK